uniref:Uncharacterized protein n=1 Tax=Ganoderma boninense TaxID=34458 RepID=A0A5K1K5Q7_9APHY|nr:Uncharacterized protein [Ganoderma boninense]
MKERTVLRRVPDFLKRFVAPFVATAKDDMSRAVSHIRPLIEERMRALEEDCENRDDKLNDALQWMLDKAIPKGETVSTITQRLFVFNFASIGTSSDLMTRALYRLADKPDLVSALREEAQECISADGWGTALGRMWKLDNLLRETMRCDGPNLGKQIPAPPTSPHSSFPHPVL